jgi:PAS domain S-box-containing protein
MGEDTAVLAMKAGAQDYLVKTNLKRLVPALERELRDMHERRERRRLEVERQASEARFRQILEVAPDAIVVVDEHQRIAAFNKAAEAMFGYTAEEAVGQLVDLLLPSRFVKGHRQHYIDFASGPDSSRRMKAGGDVFGRRKNGEEFPIEASLSKLVENGKVTCTAIVRDISERRRAEERLRQFSRAVEQSANLVVITDTDGLIQFVNARFLEATGYTADEVIGRRPSIWKSGRTGEDTYAALWQAIQAGEDWHGEFQNRRKDGSLMTVTAAISPVRDEGGRITHFIAIEEDITQRREIEAQLAQAQKMESIGQLTGGLAHDFNNLLSVIMGNLDLLQEEFATDAKARELAELALVAAGRGAELTRQLLAFARRQSLEPRVFDLNALIGQTVTLLRRTLGEAVEIGASLAGDLWPVEADPSQVESALTNLAINARDAMPGGGTITIETANRPIGSDEVAEKPDIAPGEYAMLAVSDTGTGMPPEILARVCEPFFTTKPAGKGTGLGLSMVYGFAKQSGGHLRIYSEVGHGTTVRLYLPRAGAASPTAPAERSASERAAPGGATILVVEDNAEVRTVVRRQLDELGYRVREAENAAAALAILESGAPIDLLFSDVIMPGGMLGTELAQEVRRRWPAVRILLTTGFAEAAAQNGRHVPEGMALITKPYRKRTLGEKIREVLGG